MSAGDKAKKLKNGWSVSTDKEARIICQRVLRLVNAYLKRQRQDLLVTDGRGLMSWGEIREHVKGAMNLRVKP